MVVVALIIQVAMSATNFAFGVFFKPLITEFGWTRAMTSGAFSLSWIVQGLLAIVAGVLTDRVGPRIVMTLCGFFLGLGYLLMSQVSAVWQLYLFYGVITGTGMSGVFVPLMSTVARWFVKRRTTMTGIVLTGSGIAALIAPLVASWLISTYGWRISYIILGSLVLVVVVLLAQLLQRDPTQVGQRPYGENEGEEHSLKLGAEAFPLREAVQTRQFWVVFVMLFSLGYCVYTIMVHIVPHATDLGISGASAVNILATSGGMAIVGRVVLGSAADRIGSRQAFIIGFILMAAALFWLVPTTELWMLYLFAAIFGFAFGACSSLVSPLVAGLFGLTSHGLILATITFGFTTGAAVGPFLAGYIFDVTGNYQMAFLVCAVTGVVGLVLTALLRPITGERRKIKAT